MTPGREVLLVGNPDPTHVGAHLAQAAGALGIPCRVCDVSQAFAGPAWRRRWMWRMGGHRPPALAAFSAGVVEVCRAARPRRLLATGLAPLTRGALEAVGRLGIERINYLTDDPWNPAHRAAWFLKALPSYDRIVSPRRAVVEDLQRLGCRAVSVLPFAYNPSVHFPEPPATTQERARFANDVLFAGGADRDRVPWMAGLLRAGFSVALYGEAWDRFPETRGRHLGHAGPDTLRRAVGGAKVALGLVRRANRDGHAMRTFEIPAMGGCPLMEDTDDHRALFGEEGRAALYFRALPELCEKLRWLLGREEERRRLAEAAHRLVIEGRHTYRDRLAAMLDLAS